MEDRLAEHIRREARARGLSVSAFIAKTLDDALNASGIHPGEAGTQLRLAAKARRSRVLTSNRPRELESRDDEDFALAEPHPPQVSAS